MPDASVKTPPHRADIAIAGGGIVGLSLAVALKQALGPKFSVLAIEPRSAPGARRPDPRVYAIAPRQMRFLDKLGIWPAVAGDAVPVAEMALSDSRLADLVRMPALLFGAADAATGGPLAHVVPAWRLEAALADGAGAAGVDVAVGTAQDAQCGSAGIRFRLGNGSVETRLLVAADGAGSRLRAEAGIATFGWRYRQDALTATLAHSLPHEGRAVQHFLPGGTFALLPLPGDRSALVWADAPDVIAHFRHGDGDELREAIARRAAGVFGTILSVCDVASFPLRLQIARRFHAPRRAFAGDAAHVVHPLAGQGLNLGLGDAEALAVLISKQARLGLDIGAADLLARYEGLRRPEVMAMAALTDQINRLFSNEPGPLRALRRFGLSAVDHWPGLKNVFAGHAAGRGLLARMLDRPGYF